MKRWTVSVLAIAALASCASPGPSAGTVSNKRFTAAHTDWVAGIDVPGTCSMIGKVEECNAGVHMPGHFDYYDDTWSLFLDDGHRHGWVEVPRRMYDHCQIHTWCNTNGDA